MQKECKFCKKEIEYVKIQQYGGHVSNCLDNPNRLRKAEGLKLLYKGRIPIHTPKKHEYTLNCKKCNKEYKLNLTELRYKSERYTKHCSRACANSHMRTEESKKKASESAKVSERKKTATKSMIVRIYGNCIICESLFEKRPSGRRKTCSKKCSSVLKSQASMGRKNVGGYRKGSGRGKGGWYKGYYCDSSYELAYVIYNIDHNIKFARNKQGFDYEFENKTYKYYPDFILSDDSYIEIKGFKTKQFIEKQKAVPKLKVLYKDDLKEIFDYVIKKYGSDFIRLYEGNPHDKLNNTCKSCNALCKEKNVYCSRSCSGKGNSKYSKVKE